MQIHTRIREYLAANVLYVDDAFQYDDDTSFISEGLIDSMGVMELVEFAQSEFGIKVEQHELLPDNFDSVNRLASFIGRKIGAEAVVLR